MTMHHGGRSKTMTKVNVTWADNSRSNYTCDDCFVKNGVIHMTKENRGQDFTGISLSQVKWFSISSCEEGAD